MTNNNQLNIEKVTFSDLSIADKTFDINASTFAQAVRVLRQNWRQGTVACKGRSDVARSNKKPWKQKGTGRARAGSARSPLWRGGGVIHGPQPRIATLKINKDARRSIFIALCAKMVEQGKVVVLDLNIETQLQTKYMNNLLSSLGFLNTRVLFFVDSGNISLVHALRNIPSVQTILFDEPNVGNLACSDYWIILKSDFDKFKDMVGRWL